MILGLGFPSLRVYMGHEWAELAGECTWAFRYILPTGTRVQRYYAAILALALPAG
jgi:hypothetical protein